MRALDQLPPFSGTVYRGGNEGMDQSTVIRDYVPGRPIRWAAFSSTSKSIEATKEFVERSCGVLFRIQVVAGRDIGRYSFYQNESEILLSPNSKFTVTSMLYEGDDGYKYVDLAETTGAMLHS